MASHTQPAAFFPEVEEYLGFFDGRPRHRCPILAINGGTNLAISMLAAAVLRRLGAMLPARLEEFVEVTVEDAETLGLNDFETRSVQRWEF